MAPTQHKPEPNSMHCNASQRIAARWPEGRERGGLGDDRARTRAVAYRTHLPPVYLARSFAYRPAPHPHIAPISSHPLPSSYAHMMHRPSSR